MRRSACVVSPSNYPTTLSSRPRWAPTPGDDTTGHAPSGGRPDDVVVVGRRTHLAAAEEGDDPEAEANAIRPLVDVNVRHQVSSRMLGLKVHKALDVVKAL